MATARVSGFVNIDNAAKLLPLAGLKSKVWQYSGFPAKNDK